MATTIVAIYAALIATVALAWNIYSILRDRPRAKVKVSFGHIVDPSGRSPTQIVFEAANVGRRPFTLTGVGIVLPKMGRRNLGTILAPGDFPCKIGEGEKHSCLFGLEVLKEEVRKLEIRTPPEYAWFSDATGRLHKGRIPKPVGVN